MGYLLNSGEVGNIGLEHLKQIRQKTISKWDQLGFLKGLKGHVRENIAQLYENQASHLLNESTTAADASGSFETVVFPIVRRVFSKLLANDIVSVQAMNMPIGKLFFFVPVTSDKIESNNWQDVPTSSAADGATAKNPIISGQVPECVTGFNCSVATFSTCAKSLYDRFYNDGLFDGSKGTATIQIATGTPVVWTACTSGNEFTPGTSATAFDSSVRKQIVKVTGFNPLQAGRMGN